MPKKVTYTLDGKGGEAAYVRVSQWIFFKVLQAPASIEATAQIVLAIACAENTSWGELDFFEVQTDPDHIVVKQLTVEHWGDDPFIAHRRPYEPYAGVTARFRELIDI